MSDLAIRPRPAAKPGRSRRSGFPGWASCARLLKRSNFGPAGQPGRACAAADVHPPRPGFPLLRAYAASALDLAHQVENLQSSASALSLGPVAIRALVRDVIEPLEPAAVEAGLAVLRDLDSRCDGVCCADAAQLRRVLSHLLLRALCLEQAPGHVRVMVTFSRGEAQVLILSRTTQAVLATHADAARADLVAPQRLLQAMGGSLILEPRRAGYLPLCIALPALSAAYASRAA